MPGTPLNDHAEHHPETEATAPEAVASEADTPMMPCMGAIEGMMTPEMMQMMMRMMADGGMRGGPMAEGTPGGGMMCGDMPRSGMMGRDGMPMGPMMRGGPQGHRGGHGLGPDVLYGMPNGAPREMTPAHVETFLTYLLERHGNPRLELGEITEGEKAASSPTS